MISMHYVHVWKAGKAHHRSAGTLCDLHLKSRALIAVMPNFEISFCITGGTGITRLKTIRFEIWEILGLSLKLDFGMSLEERTYPVTTLFELPSHSLFSAALVPRSYGPKTEVKKTNPPCLRSSSCALLWGFWGYPVVYIASYMAYGTRIKLIKCRCPDREKDGDCVYV
ncbi:uncharacterized protein LAJ45_05941 [Morchella importuna]|uniref:uncharacterized protein n=1 Tax=Morchella importuna TaxID=1174673 RepID=UPI001E8DB6DD|nr:uncharacterized protein LAJ45_05941 [Morchella importuna]KAH8149789.1 hypothetical protein LAJ45_05941 [Morchella importuna]